MIRNVLVSLVVCLGSLWAEVSLQGVVTDPSGASVPGAVVVLKGAGREQRVLTDATGRYAFRSLTTGGYQVRAIAKGFAVADKKTPRLEEPSVLDIQLAILTGRQIVNVEDEIAKVRTDPAANGDAMVMRERQVAALSDDPDELALQLQALAGPAAGPGGGQVFIDGFTGGNLPPKASIREVRINSNPFSPEYDKPGFGRVEIFTKPGSDTLRGQAFVQFNNEKLNSRNPLLTQSDRMPYQTLMYGANLSGPLIKNRLSFTLDADHREIDENTLVLATTLDSALRPVQINRAVVTPQTRTVFAPKIDLSISPKNTLSARYQDVRATLGNLGVGDFSLESTAYDERQVERGVQATYTTMLSTRAINETRFQFMRTSVEDRAQTAGPTIYVQGAFVGGGPMIGNTGAVTNGWEVTNTSLYTRGTHTMKWGGRARGAWLTDTSRRNFAGTFTFFTLEQYRKTLAGEPGGGPSQFTLNAGAAVADLSQTDFGLFVTDDWRMKPNFTLSYGVRYESQTNLGGLSDWAPRVGIAWGIGAKGGRPAKTVLRAGAGTFYDRLPLSLTLNALRYNGSTQKSYFIQNPGFFPNIPPLGSFDSGPQQLRPVSSLAIAPRTYQVSVALERQVAQNVRVTTSWIYSRGVHLFNQRNVNTPITGLYPYGDRAVRLLTETGGLMRMNQLMISPNVNLRRVTLMGYYSLSYGMANNEGLPADPYNLQLEWGPSSYGDVRHRAVIQSSIPVKYGLAVMPFFVANSGPPYNITTGLDPLSTGFPTARPALVAGPCSGTGCYDLNPAPGTSVIGRNSARGPASANLGLRVAKTWGFGERAEKAAPSRGGGGGHDGSMPIATPGSGRKYTLTLSASSMNAFNRTNLGPPNGVVTSPYFGQSRSLGGLIVMKHGGAASAYNRKIDLQLRLSF